MMTKYTLIGVIIAAVSTTAYLLRIFTNLPKSSSTELDEHEKQTYHDHE